jgi:cell division protein FtsB
MGFANDIEPIIVRVEKIIGLSFKIFIVTAIIVIIAGIYVANLIYGNNSLHRLEYLQQEKATIKKNITKLEQDNARLHKQYLEWEDAQK